MLEGGFVLDITEKWINDYIKNIDLENIEWVKLNSNQLYEFIQNNYLDKELWQYVIDGNSNIYPRLLGMHYLNLDSPINKKEHNFLLGIVDNNIGKKTIVCAVTYLDDYFVFDNQNEPLTYVSSVEVNSFFRNQGIYKKVCEVFFEFIINNQHILISKQSEMGKKCKVHEILKDIGIKKGFDKCIWEENCGLENLKLYEIICDNQKISK